MSKVTFVNNAKSIIANEEIASNLAIKLVLEDVARTARPKTPMLTGALRASVRIDMQSGKITWNSEYSDILENKQFQNYTTPGTGPHFARDSMNEVLDSRFNSHLKSAGLIR